MKKWFSIMLVIALLASVSVVMAEEMPEEVIFPDGQIFSDGELIPEDQMFPKEEMIPEDGIFPEDEMISEDQMVENTSPKVVPDVPYGSDMTTAISQIKADFEEGMVLFSEISDPQTISLSNGKEYQEITMSGDSTFEDYTIKTKYYFTSEGNAIAGTQDFTLTGDIDGLSVRNFLIEAYGEPETLALEELGDFAELLGESAHLENGQDLWNYTYSPKIIPSEQKEKKPNNAVNAYITLRIVDDHVYLAQYMDPDYLLKMAIPMFALNVEGYDKLTEDEQMTVSLYAEYLEAQKQEQLKQYIDFLLERH